MINVSSLSSVLTFRLLPHLSHIFSFFGFKSSINTEDTYLIRDIEEQTDVLIKYEGYIKRQNQQIENQTKTDNIKIPEDIDYNAIKQLSTESKEKLIKIKPKTIGQALRIGGVKPVDVSILMVLIEQHKLSKFNKQE